MFKINENGRLLYIAELLEVAKNKYELEWMTKCLVDSVQLVAWETATNNMNLEEWDDLYCPY